AYAKPDLALTSFSVVTEKKTVAEAMSESTKKMNAIIDFTKKQGIKEKDLKTTSFNVYPRYEYYEKTELRYSEGKRVLVGYEVRQSLQVKIRDMEKIGEIVEGATGAGANQVGDLRFTIDDEDAVKKEAREEAIDEAKAKAKELASQLGVGLVRITDFYESGGSFDSRYLGMGGGIMEKTMAMDEAPMPQIEMGENKVSVIVNITYEIN
ncbi:MAG TPA: DUF541 domain-containing protein, partial [Candidatus Peregrinibacteria bacterium]|nr:DUF541 domain-containing protein [Candidatus Peregrinibacteria bacterium]